MSAERLYVIKASVLALTFKYSLCLWVLLGELVGVKWSIGIFPYMVCIGYLLGTNCLIVERTVHAAGIAAGVYKYLALFLVGYLFKDIKFVVEVIIEDNYMVILFNFLVKSFGISYPLTGRACELEAWIVLSYVVLKYGRYHDTFVHSIVGDMHYHVAEFVAEVLLFYHGVGECEAERYALAVEILCNASYKVLLAHTVHNSSAIPERRREYAVYGCNLYALAEKLGAVFEHREKYDVEFKKPCKIRQMEPYFHWLSSLDSAIYHGNNNKHINYNIFLQK